MADKFTSFLARKDLLQESRAHRPMRIGIFKMPQTPTSSWRLLWFRTHPHKWGRTEQSNPARAPSCKWAGPKAALPELTCAGTPRGNTHTAFQMLIKYWNTWRWAGAFVWYQDRSSPSVCPSHVYRHTVIYVVSAIAVPACYISTKKCCDALGWKLTLAPSYAQESGKGSESTH